MEAPKSLSVLICGKVLTAICYGSRYFKEVGCLDSADLPCHNVIETLKCMNTGIFLKGLLEVIFLKLRIKFHM